MEQIDLETHVNEVHRANTHLAAMEQENATVPHEEQQAVDATEIMQHETEVDEDNEDEAENEDENQHTTIAVFQDYDDGKDQALGNEQALTHHNQTEPMEHEEIADENQTEIPAEYHTETSTNTSSAEEEEEENESDDYDTEEETETQTLTFGENTFACAKCTETFATVEQLRKHYEQHLAADKSTQEQPQTTPTKSQFKCNLCGKTFDLKFSLNRHVKKHKTAPI